MSKESVDDILKKYGAKIESQIKTSEADLSKKEYSQSYSKFKGEISREYSTYERWVHSLGNSIKIKPSKTDEERIQKQIDSAHLSVEVWQVLSLSIMSFVTVFFLGLLTSMAIFLLTGSFPILFFFLIVIFSIFLFYFLSQYPDRLAKKWRLKASSQMVPAILYIVVYMRHTPNLERAIQFASEHLDYPLALDFKKIFYNVEVGRYSTIKESLDAYLESWRGYSTEFIEGFHLIESSLFEPAEGQRIATLEKALQVVLDGIYNKMLKFSHSVRSPLTNVYMLGVVLPTLGLALIPLASAMMGGILKTSHIFILFNLIVPFMVYYLTDKILVLRPGGYGESSLLENNPYYPKFKSNDAFKKAFILFLPLISLSLLPFLLQFDIIAQATGIDPAMTFAELGKAFSFMGNTAIFGYLDTPTGLKGPFGPGALLLGLFFPLSVGLIFSIGYSGKTKELIIERDKTKQLEEEFNNSLFQLGNRLGNGVPPEMVFGKVAKSAQGLRTGEFFSQVNYNIQNLGMSVEKAIFDKNRGAIRFYPSALISTAMKILVESSKKGLKIAAISLINISEYIKNINKITLRLKDLLAEISSDMKSNMTFLAPLLSGIVVGLAAMITSILGRLKIEELAGQDLGSMGDLLKIFDYLEMIPPYYLQIAVGIYLIQVVFILTSTLVTVDAGEDKLETAYRTGINLKKGMWLFFIVSFISVLALTLLVSVVFNGLMS